MPTYIHIDSFNFKSGLVHPDTFHQITNVWVYYNNNPVGAFDLPATVPIIANGTGKLEIAPGIAVDGLNSLLSAYPFYEIDTSTLVAQPGKVIPRIPSTTYYPDVKVQQVSFFNTSNTGFSQAYGSEVGMTYTSADSLEFEGHSVGLISLTAANNDTLSIDSSRQSFNIPSGTAFVELSYKCNVPFYIGLQANLSTIASSTAFYLTGIYPSDHWQRFYLSVADFNAQYKGTSYNLYIKASLPAGQATGQVLLDNIQFISF